MGLITLLGKGPTEKCRVYSLISLENNVQILKPDRSSKKHLHFLKIQTSMV